MTPVMLFTIGKFDIHGSMHRIYIPIYIQLDATLDSRAVSRYK
jgi:hypothetical protein